MKLGMAENRDGNEIENDKNNHPRMKLEMPYLQGNHAYSRSVGTAGDNGRLGEGLGWNS
jgi:hypothetical protein